MVPSGAQVSERVSESVCLSAGRLDRANWTAASSDTHTQTHDNLNNRLAAPRSLLTVCLAARNLQGMLLVVLCCVMRCLNGMAT